MLSSSSSIKPLNPFSTVPKLKTKQEQHIGLQSKTVDKRHIRDRTRYLVGKSPEVQCVLRRRLNVAIGEENWISDRKVLQW